MKKQKKDNIFNENCKGIHIVESGDTIHGFVRANCYCNNVPGFISYFTDYDNKISWASAHKWDKSVLTVEIPENATIINNGEKLPFEPKSVITNNIIIKNVEYIHRKRKSWFTLEKNYPLKSWFTLEKSCRCFDTLSGKEYSRKTKLPSNFSESQITFDEGIYVQKTNMRQ